MSCAHAVASFRGLEQQARQIWQSSKHGDLPQWTAAYQALPEARPSSLDLNAAAVRIGQPGDLSQEQRTCLEQSLRSVMPWRKGPFELFGIKIDAEWRSDMKWQRVMAQIADLQDRRVLDVGCGNGYYAWRMLGQGARYVLGIDPYLIYVMQFRMLQRYAQDARLAVLPLGIEHLTQELHAGFDTVFSMGLLYHRKDPLEHLCALKQYLAPQGELVLETLVIAGKAGEALNPKQRYAQMRNVWQVPACATVSAWLAQAGYSRIRCVDVTKTLPEEQRRTDWMGFYSLEDFLDPLDASRTLEGYPAPIRAVFLASAP